MIGVRNIDAATLSECVVCSYVGGAKGPSSVCPECGTDYASVSKAFAFEQDDRLWMQYIWFCAVGLGGLLISPNYALRALSGCLAIGSIGYLVYVLRRVPPLKRRSYLLICGDSWLVVGPRKYFAERLSVGRSADEDLRLGCARDGFGQGSQLHPRQLDWESGLGWTSRRLGVPASDLAKVLSGNAGM